MSYTFVKTLADTATKCDDCGLLVGDRERHDTWHQELAADEGAVRLAITPEFIEAVHRGLLRRKRKAGGRHLGLA